MSTKIEKYSNCELAMVGAMHEMSRAASQIWYWTWIPVTALCVGGAVSTVLTYIPAIGPTLVIIGWIITAIILTIAFMIIGAIKPSWMGLKHAPQYIKDRHINSYLKQIKLRDRLISVGKKVAIETIKD